MEANKLFHHGTNGRRAALKKSREGKRKRKRIGYACSSRPPYVTPSGLGKFVRSSSLSLSVSLSQARNTPIWSDNFGFPDFNSGAVHFILLQPRESKGKGRQPTMRQNQVVSRHGIIHFPASSGVSEWCERTDERVAQYMHLDSWLFWTIAQPPEAVSVSQAY